MSDIRFTLKPVTKPSTKNVVHRERRARPARAVDRGVNSGLRRSCGGAG